MGDTPKVPDLSGIIKSGKIVVQVTGRQEVKSNDPRVVVVRRD